MRPLKPQTIEQLQEQLRMQIATRDSIYRSVQDFRVSSNKTDEAIKQLEQINREIATLERAIKKKVPAPVNDIATRKEKWLQS